MESGGTSSLPSTIELETRSVSRVAVLPGEYRGIKAELCCAVGDDIAAGEVLLRDLQQPQICITSPLAGRVIDIRRGARRSLTAIILAVEEAPGGAALTPPPVGDPVALREFLCLTGAWSSLRARPFGRVPRADAEPMAVFVAALDRQPGAPAPEPLIESCADEFRAGIDALAAICSAPVYVCHANGYEPPIETSDRLRCVAFDEGPGAGLPGVHIHALCPIGFAGGEVWQLDYQEVIAWGWLLLHGSSWHWRLLSLYGDGLGNPRNLLVPPGAALDELLDGELIDAPTRIFAGSEIYGHPLATLQSFAGPGLRQLTVRNAAHLDAAQAPLNAAVVIPSDRLDDLAPPGIYPVPLMRALQIGDAERARQLGALELLEEDVAPLSRACVSRLDYGRLLRQVLTKLEAEG